MTEDQLTQDLAALYRPVDPPPGGLDDAQRAGERRRRSRRIALAATVTAATLSVAGLVVAGSLSLSSQPVHLQTGGQVATPPVTAGTPPVTAGNGPAPFEPAEAPVALSADPPHLLPPSSVSMTGLQLDRSAGDTTYQRAYLGTQAVNPAQLVVQTVDVNQGHYTPNLLSTQNFSPTETFSIGAVTATLSPQGDDLTYLWWKTTNGVEVDMAASGLTTPELTAVASGTTPTPTYRLGLSLPAGLPAGLHQIGAALTRQAGIPMAREMYAQGGCAVQLGVFSGFPAPDPVLGTTTVTTFAGGVAEVNIITKNATNPSGGAVLIWSPTPGVSAQLSTNGTTSCDPTILATQLRSASTTQWNAVVQQLGSRVQQLNETVAPPSTAPPTSSAR